MVDGLPSISLVSRTFLLMMDAAYFHFCCLLAQHRHMSTKQFSCLKVLVDGSMIHLCGSQLGRCNLCLGGLSHVALTGVSEVTVSSSRAHWFRLNGVCLIELVLSRLN